MAALTRDQFKRIVLETETELFVSMMLMDRLPLIFANRLEYAQWKMTIAKALKVDPSALWVCGSAALGFSLDPNKNAKAFDSDSDVDLAVISNYHFELAWWYLRNEAPLATTTLSSQARNSLADHRTRHLFNGIIDTRALLPYFQFGKEWERSLEDFSTRPPINGKSLNIRLYRDTNSLSTALGKSVNAVRAMFTP